jgi:hypothetical protein
MEFQGPQIAPGRRNTGLSLADSFASFAFSDRGEI